MRWWAPARLWRSSSSLGSTSSQLVLDDGTDQVEESFTVIVKKEEESPGPGLVAAIAAVVLTGLVMVRRRGQRPAHRHNFRARSA